MNPLVCILTIGVLLAGCTADTPDQTTVEKDLVGWELANDVAGCSEQVGVLLVEPGVAQAALPEGFTAVDASNLLDLPAPTGKEAFFFNAVVCDEGSSAEVAVPIVAPQWDGEDLPAVRYSFYQLGYMNSDEQLVQRLQETGYPAFLGEASGDVMVTGVAGMGAAAVAAGPDLDFAFDSAVVGPEAMDITARFWHVTEVGIVHLEYDIRGSGAFKGTITECRFAPGSILHEASGRSDCQGEQTAVLSFPSQDWAGLVRFTPGAQVA